VRACLEEPWILEHVCVLVVLKITANYEAQEVLVDEGPLLETSSQNAQTNQRAFAIRVSMMMFTTSGGARLVASLSWPKFTMQLPLELW